MPKSSRSLRSRLALAVVTLIVVAPLAACGSAGDTTTAKANKNGLIPVTVLRSTGATFEPLYVAEQQGYFKKAGLEVTIKAGAQDTSQNAPSVINGEAQFAMTDSSGFLKGAAQNLPVRIVSGLQSSTTKTAPSDGLLVKPDSEIKTFGDLPGKTVALAALGGTIHLICEYLVKQDGGDPSKVKFVSLPLTSLNDAVSSGKVDAAFTFASYYSAGMSAGLKAIGKGTNELPGLTQGLLFSSQKYLAANPVTAKKFIDAVAEGIDYANSHPDDVRAIDTTYTKLPAAYIKERDVQMFSAEINTTVMGTVITSMVDFGLLTNAPKDGALYWDQAPTTTSSS